MLFREIIEVLRCLELCGRGLLSVMWNRPLYKEAYNMTDFVSKV